MELWLKTPDAGIEGGIDYPHHCKIKVSDDGGQSWQQISTTDVTWGSLFLAQGKLYLIGNDPRSRAIVIARSLDEGKSWQPTVTLFDDSHYHGGCTAVVFKNGFVYRAFEDSDLGSASLVIAGDLTQDLLDPSTWRMSPKVEPPRHTPSLSRQAAQNIKGFDAGGNYFLEGNVVDIRGRLHVLLRTRIDKQLTSGVVSVCRLADDGKEMTYEFVQFHPMIGGQNKFKILYDEESDLFWTCSTFVPDAYQDPQLLGERGFKGSGGNSRRILMLCYSRDALSWLPAGCVAMSRNPLESFHYSSQVVDGKDLLVLSRTSIGGLPHNNHDSNLITFHRVRRFRSFALNLRSDFSATSAQALTSPIAEDSTRGSR